MAKKKVRRAKKSPKKTAEKVKGIGSASPDSPFYKNKFRFVLRNFLFFMALLLVSALLYLLSNQEMYENLFYFLTMLFFFITIAYLIVLIIFLVLRVIKK